MNPVLSKQPAVGHITSQKEEPLVESDSGAEIDEPPDSSTPKMGDFQKRRDVGRLTHEQQSLLTKALHDEESVDQLHLNSTRKRPSVASNASMASTFELTCDTGRTTPARAPTPSPPHPEMMYLLNHPIQDDKEIRKTAPVRQRRISFACAGPPEIVFQQPNYISPKPTEKVKRPAIKFVCTAQPTKTLTQEAPAPERRTSLKFAVPARPCEVPAIGPSNEIAGRNDIRRPTTPIQVPDISKSTNVGKMNNFIAATNDLQFEVSRFHEFASEESCPDDWIVQDTCIQKSRLTMSDILEKELAIRKLGEEALEEEEAEEDEYQSVADGADASDDDDADEEDQDYFGLDHEDHDGYNTDNEYGFADSDDDLDNVGSDEVEVDVPVWFPANSPVNVSPAEDQKIAASFESNSSALATHVRDIPTRRMRISRDNSSLADSADFVCGTFDEDRIVEDIYLTAVAAHKRSKLLAIPQDIDPSFPASDPEDEDEEKVMSNLALNDSGDHITGFGELEGLYGQENSDRRRRRSDTCSPRTRYRSPPPKKYVSPPFKARGRSPRPLFGRTPSRRLQSPPPFAYPKSPRASPIHKAGNTCKPLAARPGLIFTKSLPRPAGLFPSHLKSRRKPGHSSKGIHTRGAIDIVKGLEQKRQRRREKYLQKYCDRARKGQIPEKKPVLPGQGVERMRELGLYMAGKLGPGYVLSI